MRSLLVHLLPPLWFALLLLPFRGARAAFVLFAVLAVLLAAGKATWHAVAGWRPRLPSLPALRWRHVDIATFALLLALPLFAGGYLLDVLVLTGIYVILAQGLNVVVGYAGLLNLGFAAFYAIGAYTYALLSTRLGMGFWPALPFATGAAALAGALLSVPALRLRGDYLAIVTLGFGEIVRLVLNNWDGLTNGPNGISGIPRPSLFGLELTGTENFYYFVLVAAALSVLVIRNVCASKVGRAWLAIREDETAASASGVNTLAYKLYALSFGAFFAGLAGALFAAKMQFVSPESFTFMESVIVLCMVILGGQGSVRGVVLGAALLVVLPEMLREAQSYRMLVLGVGLVALMIFRPQGLLGRKSAS